MGLLINKIVVFVVLRRESITSRKSHCCDALWSECVIVPYFFENDDEFIIVIMYHQFGTLWPYDKRLFLPAIEEYDLENMWFQQDCATCHITWANMALLQEIFPDHVISRRCDTNWPPRSSDLTPLDFFVR